MQVWANLVQMLFPAFNNARKTYFLIEAFRLTPHSLSHTKYLCHDVKMCKHLVHRKCNLEVVCVCVCVCLCMCTVIH